MEFFIHCITWKFAGSVKNCSEIDKWACLFDRYLRVICLRFELSKSDILTEIWFVTEISVKIDESTTYEIKKVTSINIMPTFTLIKMLKNCLSPRNQMPWYFLHERGYPQWPSFSFPSIIDQNCYLPLHLPKTQPLLTL